MFIKQQARINLCSLLLAAKISENQAPFKSFAKLVKIYLNGTKYLDFLLSRTFFESNSAGANWNSLNGKENIKQRMSIANISFRAELNFYSAMANKNTE